MNFLKSRFKYHKDQRNGIFFLLLIIVVLQSVFFFVDFSSEEIKDVSNNEILAFNKERDSLKIVELESRKPKIYPFNPNYITDYKGYNLGMSVDEIDRLLKFRAQGKFANSIAEFQKVTKVNGSLLNKISPYFKFPDWVTSKNKKKVNKSTQTKKDKIIVKDINTASVEDLIKIKGVGVKLATRIVKYRNKLQGFSFNNQLLEVWYLDKEVGEAVLKNYQVLTIPSIKKINVNTAPFKQVLAIVYLDYELTKKIFNYKNEVAEIQSIEELKKIDGFPIEKFDRIALYLLAE